MRDLGRTDYGVAHELQRDLHRARSAGLAPDTLLLTEHSPVITLGRNQTTPDLRAPLHQIEALGIPIVQAERGGDITYHGPGQLVVYGIIDLRGWAIGVVDYVAGLEEAATRALWAYGIAAGRRVGSRGCWVEGRKIASVGVHVSQGVTMHGIAINVDLDLAPFDLINPCGLAGVQMTSILRESESGPTMGEFGQAFVRAFGDVFGVETGLSARIEHARADPGADVAAAAGCPHPRE